MQKCDFSKVALHRLPLKPGPTPWTKTQKNLDPEKTWLMKNVGNSWTQKKKKIGRPHGVIYYYTKILEKETCKLDIWKSSHWGFLGIQETCLRLRVKMNSKAISKSDCVINLISFKNFSQEMKHCSRYYAHLDVS